MKIIIQSILRGTAISAALMVLYSALQYLGIVDSSCPHTTQHMMGVGFSAGSLGAFGALKTSKTKAGKIAQAINYAVCLYEDTQDPRIRSVLDPIIKSLQ